MMDGIVLKVTSEFTFIRMIPHHKQIVYHFAEIGQVEVYAYHVLVKFRISDGR